MRLVVEADAPDFAGPLVGKAQASFGQRDGCGEVFGEIAEGGCVRVANELEQITGIARAAFDVDVGDGQQLVTFKNCGEFGAVELRGTQFHRSAIISQQGG